MAAAAHGPAVFLHEVDDHRWRFFRAIAAARLVVALSLGLLLPAQRSLHGSLFPAIVALWAVLAVWVIVTTAYRRQLYGLLNRAPAWLWVEEVIVVVLLVVGGGFRNVFYFYGATPIVLASVFVGARMALALAATNSVLLALAFGAAHFVQFDPAIERARFTEWWGAIVGYFVVGFLFAYLRTLWDRIRQTATAYEAVGARLETAEREAAALRARRRQLTEREVEILALLAAGMTNREIADRVFLAEQSVKNHLRRLFAKLGVSNRTAAAALARNERLVCLPHPDAPDRPSSD